MYGKVGLCTHSTRREKEIRWPSFILLSMVAWHGARGVVKVKGQSMVYKTSRLRLVTPPALTLRHHEGPSATARLDPHVLLQNMTRVGLFHASKRDSPSSVQQQKTDPLTKKKKKKHYTRNSTTQLSPQDMDTLVVSCRVLSNPAPVRTKLRAAAACPVPVPSYLGQPRGCDELLVRGGESLRDGLLHDNI